MHGMILILIAASAKICALEAPQPLDTPQSAGSAIQAIEKSVAKLEQRRMALQTSFAGGITPEIIMQVFARLPDTSGPNDRYFVGMPAEQAAKITYLGWEMTSLANGTGTGSAVRIYLIYNDPSAKRRLMIPVSETEDGLKFAALPFDFRPLPE